MPILRDWDLKLDVDQVLRGQGANPAVVRTRSPRLVELAGRALGEGLPLLEPVVLYHQFAVEAFQHDRLMLAGGATLTGSLVAQHLARSQYVLAVLCTIGDALERRARELVATESLYALALDGLGSAAAEELANSACRYFEDGGKADGMQSTIPLSPGMIGWPVEESQHQIFALLDASRVGVVLTESSVMTPVKSISMVLGLGHDVSSDSRICDYCTMRETCRYRAEIA
jgi:hypothetical protein